ncbi:MAG: SDR family oxidoreductase [Candidatus Eisenbacteria bacterium]|nr:SDR family oxidoreductase [Candidatus Eisenbacteria bacterium]
MRLDGQVALISGASRGLGLAIARALAAEGASISCVARAGDALEQAVEGLRAAGTDALAAPADVTVAAEIEGAARATLERWGRLDIVVLNAGTWQGAPVHETSEELWDTLLDLNLKGAFLTLKATLPWLIEQKRGTIVGVGSLGGRVGQPGAAAYAASKWGLRGLLESVALEVKPHRIRVSIVSPHSVNSAGRRIEPGSPERDRVLEPAEVASLVAFICAAPEHVALGDVTIWPVSAGIVSRG